MSSIINKMEKLHLIWFEKIKTGDKIDATDLYQFSKISLKRKRVRKKFNKHFERYVSNKIYNTYFGILCASPLVSSFKTISDLNVEPIGGPSGKIYYPEFNRSVSE